MKQINLAAKLLFILLMLVPLVNYAQQDTSKINIPMKKGKIFYAATYPLNNKISKAETIARAKQWLTKTYPDQLQTIGETANEINGTGLFKVVTTTKGNYYWLRFSINIAVSDSGYTIAATNYYEKPIEPGITNDYSKIEYRWWDYRRGHPWSVEDKPLFKGLDLNSLALMALLKMEMDQ